MVKNRISNLQREALEHETAQLPRERLKRIQQEQQRLKEQQRLFVKQQKNWQNLPADPYIEPPPEDSPSTSSTSPSKPLKVGYPIFVLNLPKSGTTTIWQYFECGLGPNHAAHFWANSTITDAKATPPPKPAGGKKPPPANEAAVISKHIGPCVEHNILSGQEEDILPLHRCGQFDVWIDIGYATPKGQCWFPAVHGYKQLYDAYPNATFLMIPRQTEAWYKSASRWGGGAMLRKWKNSCGTTFFPSINNNSTNNGGGSLSMIQNEDFKEFYTRTIDNLRQFAKENPNFNYIEPPPEITLESPDVATWLQETIGIDSSCWPGKCQPDGQEAKCVPSSKQQSQQQSSPSQPLEEKQEKGYKPSPPPPPQKRKKENNFEWMGGFIILLIFLFLGKRNHLYTKRGGRRRIKREKSLDATLPEGAPALPIRSGGRRKAIGRRVTLRDSSIGGSSRRSSSVSMDDSSSTVEGIEEIEASCLTLQKAQEEGRNEIS